MERERKYYRIEYWLKNDNAQTEIYQKPYILQWTKYPKMHV